MARLSDKERSLLMVYVERVNEQADRWSTDRFRVGHALGAMLGFPRRSQLSEVSQPAVTVCP